MLSLLTVSLAFSFVLNTALAAPGAVGTRDSKGEFSLLGRARSDPSGGYVPINACNGTFFMGVKPGAHGCSVLVHSNGTPYKGPTLLDFSKSPQDNYGPLVVTYRAQSYYISHNGPLDTTGYGHGSPPNYFVPNDAYKGTFSITKRNNGKFAFHPSSKTKRDAGSSKHASGGAKWYACSGQFAHTPRAQAPVRSGIYKIFAAVPSVMFPGGSPRKAGCFSVDIITKAQLGDGPAEY